MTLPTRNTPAQAADAEQEPPREKMANITIEVGPLGITVRAEYTGPISSIPRCVTRMQEEGILDVVRTHATNGSATKKAAGPRTQPAYDGEGTPICPVHRKPLKDGQYGMYCSAMAKGDEAANAKGYCALRFEE